MEGQIINLTIFLIKDYVENFKECLKNKGTLQCSNLRSEYNLDGVICYCDSSQKAPRWKAYLEQFAKDKINIADNASNKAIMLVKIKERILAIVFGYGRAFLREEHIERNFGFKVALNTINPDKMRSINAATIEDMVVNTQRQASYSTSQDEFGLNVTNDIMKGITGEPFDKVYGNHISGKDSLVVSVFMDLTELKEKLELYYEAYTSNRYKNIGFEWVDNVAEVRDSMLLEELDSQLYLAIENKNTEHLHISPPENTDWDRIIGFCYSGMGKKTSEAESYNLDLDISEYINSIRENRNISQKVRRDKLYAINSDDTTFAICNIYSALIFQTEYKSKNYIFCSGSWYQVETSFFKQVNDFIENRIPISSLAFPECPKGKSEGDYNKMVADGNVDYCLFDCKMLSADGSPKKIEACDIFTKQKQFIHVKNKGQSAQLSHLFAQGKVSAECFVSDKSFRKQVLEIAIKKFGSEPFDASVRPMSNEYEVVYAIIDDKDSDIKAKLPFFSKVNLMLTAQELERMHFKFSICLIKRQS